MTTCVDEDGDAALLINGVTVGYFSQYDGSFYKSYLATADRLRLEAAGIKFSEGYFAVSS